MKILVVADEESRYLWDYYQEGMFDDIDLILSAGDLNHEYLSFLVTMAHCPLLYVHGNHDDSYERKPPEGCICIEDQIYEYQGIRILGLGGSKRYRPDSIHQYTEAQMMRRMLGLTFPLLYHGSFDILLTHAPARGFHDSKDLPHQGFEVFNRLIRRFHPRYHIHGHVHKSYGKDFCRLDHREGTSVINAYERFCFEYSADSTLVNERIYPL